MSESTNTNINQYPAVLEFEEQYKDARDIKRLRTRSELSLAVQRTYNRWTTRSIITGRGVPAQSVIRSMDLDALWTEENESLAELDAIRQA